MQCCMVSFPKSIGWQFGFKYQMSQENHLTFLLWFSLRWVFAVPLCDQCPALSLRGSRNFTSVQVLVISHIPSANTAYFSPLHLGAPSHAHAHEHTQRARVRLFILHLCTCVCTPIQTSHLFSLLNNTPLLSFSLQNRCGCQNVPKAPLLHRSVQYSWYLDWFSWTYAAHLQG